MHTRRCSHLGLHLIPSTNARLAFGMLSTVKSFHVDDMADQRPGAGTLVLSAADQDQLLSKIHKLNSHLLSMDEENIR